MKTLVIAGGSGFLGQVLARHFISKSWRVVILTRNPKEQVAFGEIVPWFTDESNEWIQLLERADAVINLCGKTVNCRYNRKNREEIVQSRVTPTLTLAKAISTCQKPPPVWLNASSATIYEDSRRQPMDETTGQLGHGFSVDVCKAWEKAFFETPLPKTRRVALRTSMVLGKGKNSVYPVLSRLARWGLGGRFGPGDQLVSWIHESDFARAVEHLIEDDRLEGPINLTAPAPLPNKGFMLQLRHSLNKRFGIPHSLPALSFGAWALRTETELTLKSRYVVPEKLLQSRFLFRFPFIDEALNALAK